MITHIKTTDADTADYQKWIGIVADNHVEIKSLTKHAIDRQ